MTLKIQAIEIVNENLNVIFHQDRYLDLEIVSNESPCVRKLQIQNNVLFGTFNSEDTSVTRSQEAC